jgi:hypothetical protein
MDLNTIRQKLSNMNSKNNKGGSKVDYEKLYWKPAIGKQTIRIVPSKFDDKSPFKELFFYYGIGNKMMLSPLSWGEKDPIAEFVKQLRKSSDKEDWRLAKKLEPKLRVFAPVIVRGEEDKGVRLWQFGKEVYMEFLSMADDEDIQDFTDVAEGRDFTVDTVGPDTTGTAYNKSSIRPKTKISPLSSTKEEIEKYLNNQPDPSEAFKRYTFDEMKSALQSWLAPDEESGEEEEEEEVIPPTTDLPWDKPTVKSKTSPNYTLSTTKKDNKSKFDDLFEKD